MKNRFRFFGIKSPTRKEADKQLFVRQGLPPVELLPDILRLLWQNDEREMQYHGLTLAEKFVKKRYASSFPDDLLPVFEECIVQRSWWDTVDFLASRLVGRYFRLFPELIYPNVERWIATPNMWLNRVAIIYQLGYKQFTDEEILFRAIRRHSSSKEFFHKKAIGWALREYAKTAPEIVRSFIAQHTLQPLSIREAMKHI